jgi:hypothetical protein
MLGLLSDPEDGVNMFSETSRLHIPQDITLHSDRCENLKSSYLYVCSLFNDDDSCTKDIYGHYGVLLMFLWEVVTDVTYLLTYSRS